MKAKNGYKKQKTEYSTGKWLKRYFEKFTCRKPLNESDNKDCAATQSEIAAPKPPDGGFA